ncbi:hypothetical protein AVEN_1827-1 [Araneus ventricosus]|uniref:Uncharacterized protein n=1 Tax=Araneus ventricosus TaxID=182803 RepID=A0A4Y2TZR7_ARAVE|nr:hypothetical protein AVEN_1827-1 [Araneus ventricosus]
MRAHFNQAIQGSFRTFCSFNNATRSSTYFAMKWRFSLSIFHGAIHCRFQPLCSLGRLLIVFKSRFIHITASRFIAMPSHLSVLKIVPLPYGILHQYPRFSHSHYPNPAFSHLTAT